MATGKGTRLLETTDRTSFFNFKVAQKMYDYWVKKMTQPNLHCVSSLMFRVL